MSKQRLGVNPFDERKGVNALIQDTRKTAKGKAGKPAKQQATKKVTYYIRPELIKSLKFLAIDRDSDQSKLMNEAIEDLLKKHRGK